MNTRIRRPRTALAIAAIALSSAVAPLGGGSASAAPAASASTAVTRSFRCTGIISRVYTRQTVTGNLTGLKPSAVSVQNHLGTVVHTKANPNKANGWWGGVYKLTDHMNQWNLGAAVDSTVFHLMLPDTRMGGTFQAVLVSEFGGGTQGNWQNHMDCTAT